MMTQILLGITLTGTLTSFVSLVVLHILPTKLSPLKDPVSAYGISKYWQLYRLQTVATGIAALALAVALLLRGGSHIALAIFFLAIFGIARIVISWFPMDAPDTPQTKTGRLHGLLALVTFAAISLSGFKIAVVFANTPHLHAYATVGDWLGWGMTAASLLTLLSVRTHLKNVGFGIFERLIYVGMFGLLGYSALVLL